MRVWGPDHPAVDHAGPIDIQGVFSAARYFIWAVETLDRSADQNGFFGPSPFLREFTDRLIWIYSLRILRTSHGTPPSLLKPPQILERMCHSGRCFHRGLSGSVRVWR